MATRGENCNDWPRTVMTGGCSLVAFAPDGATGKMMMMMKIQTKTINISTRLCCFRLTFNISKLFYSKQTSMLFLRANKFFFREQ